MGRATEYTPEIGERICNAIATSRNGLRGTLEADPELPALGTVEQWLRDHAIFSSDYAQAKMRQLQMLAEDIIDISRDDSLEPNDKRIQIDALKWLLSKLIPKTYGDKLDVTSGGEALAAPPHQIDARVQSIIMQARMRKQGVDTTVIDLEPEALKLLD